MEKAQHYRFTDIREMYRTVGAPEEFDYLHRERKEMMADGRLRE